jgi:hypothetical protein
VFVFLVLCFQFGSVSGQPDWKLVAHEDGIQVYCRSVAGSKIRALKATFEIHSGLRQVVSLLLDLNAAKQWIGHTKSCSLLKQISPSELYYYTEVALPWPLNNRDFVSHMEIFQDPVSYIVTINIPPVSGMISERPGIVRINQAIGNWLLKPLGKGRIKVEYTLQVDPGGIIPAYVVNFFAVKAPILSIKKMQKILPHYKSKKQAKFPILEP